MSFTNAANELFVTKGALSYQMKKLEQELGFLLFSRDKNKISLTAKGAELLVLTRSSLHSLETGIRQLQVNDSQSITVGMSTYFASRWLSPRLMGFTHANTAISLRIQPTLGLMDLDARGLDMEIRWGDGHWNDQVCELLFRCPAIPTAGKKLAKKIKRAGLKKLLPELTLLHDLEGSQSWEHWHNAAGFDYNNRSENLVIPDPNVRVQAVIDEQGLALNDFLIEDEIRRGTLYQVSDIELNDYGYYLAFSSSSSSNPAIQLFRDWLVDEAQDYST